MDCSLMHCRVYDVRNLKQSLHVLGAAMGEVRSLQFSGDGRFLAAGEHADFVQIFEFGGSAQCARSQTIDFFGAMLAS